MPTYLKWQHDYTNCTLTACDVSGKTSRFCGSWSRVTIHRCVSTCCRLMRWCGSICSIRVTRSLAAGDTTSQLPPLSANLPSPIRAKICSAESSGPLANGVCLQFTHTHTDTDTHMQTLVASLVLTKLNCVHTCTHMYTDTHTHTLTNHNLWLRSNMHKHYTCQPPHVLST